MKLFFLVLNHPEHLEEVLAAFVEAGVSGATVLDTVGMGALLKQELPIFAGLRDLLGARSANKTILAVVESGLVPEVIALVEESIGPLSKAGVGVAFTLPVDQAWGMAGTLQMDY